MKYGNLFVCTKILICNNTNFYVKLLWSKFMCEAEELKGRQLELRQGFGKKEKTKEQEKKKKKEEKKKKKEWKTKD